MNKAYFAKIRAVIDEHGYMLQGVGPSPRNAAFVYSVGLSRMQRAEIIAIFNIDLNMLGAIVKTAIAAGSDYQDWSLASKVLRSHNVVFREVDPVSARRKALVTRKLYPDFRLLQMFFPDMNGRFPWDAECDANLSGQQCLQYISPPPPTRH